jgi:hypothetical protein
LAGVSGVQPQVREAREAIGRGCFEQKLDAVAVLDFGVVDPRFEHQPLRVHQKMALSSFDLLGSVVAALLSAHPGRFDRLAVHYGCAGLRVPLQTDSNPLAQG